MSGKLYINYSIEISMSDVSGRQPHELERAVEKKSRAFVEKVMKILMEVRSEETHNVCNV